MSDENTRDLQARIELLERNTEAMKDALLELGACLESHLRLHDKVTEPTVERN